MKRPTPVLRAAAMLVCLPLMAQAVAQSVPPDASVPDFQENEAASLAPEDFDESSMAPMDEAAQPPPAGEDGEDGEDGTPYPAYDEASPGNELSAADAAQPATPEHAAGTGFKHRVKAMLVGLLLPEMERQVRKAIGSEDPPAPSPAEAGDGFGSEQAQEADDGTTP